MDTAWCKLKVTGKQSDFFPGEKAVMGDPSRRAWWSKGYFLGFALVVVGSAFLFSHLRASPRSPDEQAYLAWAVSFALENKMAEPDGRSVSKNVPPLHTLMVGIAFKSLGIKTEAAQVVSVLGGALSAGVCFLMGCLLMGVRGGLLAAVLFVTSGKGEIWEYSNRVLNDIFLTLWLGCILLCAMAYMRWGTYSMALAMGLFLGMGFLTKESVLLGFPVILAALFLGRRPKGKRLMHFLVATIVAGSLMAPLILHRYNNLVKLRAAQEAPRHGLRAGNLATLLDPHKWGFRGFKELGDNILLRGMPSGAFKVIYGISLVACLVLLWKGKAPNELILPLLLILVWIGVFQVFVHLPLTRRQLLPLFPAYNLLAALVLTSSWKLLKSRVGEGRVHTKIAGFAGWAGVLSLVLLNMPPQAWSGVNWGEPLKKPQPNFLEKEAQEALACVPEGSLIASNLDRTLFFLLKGTSPVLHLQAAQGQGAGKSVHSKKGRKQSRPELKEGSAGDQLSLLFPNEQAQISSPIYAIIFFPRESFIPGTPLPTEEAWEVVCKGKGFVVSRRLGGSQPG